MKNVKVDFFILFIILISTSESKFELKQTFVVFYGN